MSTSTLRISTPRNELADITADALARGLSRLELLKIQKLGDDGYGVIAQLEQLYVWLASHPAR
jgi:hypothetical protein